MTTITASSTIGITLSAPAYTSPIYIETGVTISGSGGDDAAIQVALGSTAFFVQNNGAIYGTNPTTGAGIYLYPSGSVTNATSATIIGYNGVGIADGTGTVVNEGSIAGTGTDAGGVLMTAGGLVTNAASAEITGGSGVEISGGFGTVFNDGIITSAATYGIGVALSGGGFVTNQSGATISGRQGFSGTNIAATVVNYGHISGNATTGTAIDISAGGAITNQSNGTISGNTGISAFSSPLLTIVNEGDIEGNTTSGTGVIIAGGSIINQNGATISGASGILAEVAASTIVNYGSIAATGAGINVQAGGSITNKAGASISGLTGIFGAQNAFTITNGGHIAGNITSFSGAGAHFGAGGSVTNQSSGVIVGYAGIYGRIASTTILNYGSVAGNATSSLGDGVRLYGGGSVTNHGEIVGYTGIYALAPATVINFGAVAATGSRPSAVDLHVGGSVTNAASALIAGGTAGVNFGVGDGIVVNDGTITATYSSGIGVALGIGTVVNNGSIVAKEFGVDIASGTLVNNGIIKNGLGSGVGVGSGSIMNGVAGVIQGVEMGGGLDPAGTVINDGTIAGVFLFSGGTLTNAGTIYDGVYFGGKGHNRFVLNPGFALSGQVEGSAYASNTLELASAASAGIVNLGTQFIIHFGSITFDAGADWFISGNTTGLAGTISGFAFGDTIEVTGIAATGSAYSGGILTLTEESGSVALKLPGSFATSDFVVHNVAAGADITVTCFRAGTRIGTSRGEVEVERLREGEIVLAHAGDGRMTSQPIVWIGYRSVDCRRHPRPKLVWPVHIRAGALGPRQPRRDLFLSPDHAVFIDGVLIPVKYLINDRTIAQVPVASVEYFHVELSAHAVLLAEGLPVESYLDIGDRTNFGSGAERTILHPDFATRAWNAHGCSELVVTGPQLQAARAWIESVAADCVRAA